MTTTATPVERSRASIRSWVRTAGSGLRKAGPYGIVAFLAAAAVAPVAGAALGAPGEYSVALGQLGGMGSNFLSESLMAAGARLRGSAEVTQDEWRAAVAAELLDRLQAGDVALRDEVAGLLQAVGAVDVALRAADERTREELAVAFGALDALAQDASRSLAEIGRRLAEQAREQRLQTDMLRQSLVVTARIQQDLSERRTAGPAPTGPPAGADAASPYPGLTSFDALDARFFRGRESLVAELLGRLSEQLVGGPPLVVVGVSGVGKSSLLRAGVWPAVAGNGLGEEVAGWPWLVMTPGENPLAEYTDRVAALGTDRFVILVDQFEELFTQCEDPEERAAFVAALAAARPALLLIAVRADFYPQCTELPPMVPLLGAGQVVVGPLGDNDLRRAIREPAAEAGLTVEAGLEELLLTDLGAPDYQPGALPLLAHALRATWERREGATMTVAGYRRTGGIRRAVAETAERIHLALDDAGRASLRAALLSLVTVVDGMPVRHRSTPAETDLAVLRPMIQARLVTAGREAVEISHEALLTGWPRLAGWLVEAREEILLRHRLAQATAEWSAAGEDTDALYRGARLAAAREWAAGHREVPPAQRRFLAASEAAAQAQQLAQRRTNRRLRRLVAGLAVALVLAASGGLVAWQQRVQADRDSRAATSRQLAAEARTEHWARPDSSARKSLRAWQSAATAEARGALLYAQHTTVSGQLGTEPGALAVAVSPDGGLIAVGFADGRVQLWDSTTQQQVGAMRHPAGKLTSLRFSPDGRFLAGGAIARRGVAVWDVAGGRLRRLLPGFGAVGWLPDSSAVLANRTDVTPLGQVGGWDPETGRVTTLVTSGVPVAIALAVSRDGRYLALAGADRAELVRRADGRRLASLGPEVTSVGFAADGTLFSVGVEGKVRAWRPAGNRRPITLNNLETGDTGAHLAVTRDGTAIVGGDEAREILAMTLGGPRQPVTGFPGVPFDLALSPDDRLLAVTSLSAPARLIRLGGDQLPHPQIVGFLAFDATGQRLATASSDPAIRVWDPRTSALRDTIVVPGGSEPLGLAYAPDGSLAASFADGRVLVFDPDHRVRGTLRVDRGLYPGDVAFSPDGALLTVVSTFRNNDPNVRMREVEDRDDPDVQVWDARTLRPRASLKLPGHLSITQAYTPDGRYLLVGSNRTSDDKGPQDAAIWRFRVPELTLAERRDLPGSPVVEMAVSPDSTLVALAQGQRAPVLRVEGLTPVRTLGEHPVPLSRVAWSPDGRTVATATDTDDDVPRLWRADTGSLIAEIRANSSQFGQLAFSPDGATLAAGENDWTVALWHLDPADAVRRVCAMLVPASRHGGEALPATCR